MSAISFNLDDAYCFYRGRVGLFALLQALDIQAGDEILLPGFTCIAVAHAIVGLGARPVYLDIEAGRYNLSHASLQERITARSRVLIVQHTYGIPCEMDSILALAEKHRLMVIEDCCHVTGSKYKGRPLGSMGDAALWAFGPGKPIVAGLGGAVTLNNGELRERIASAYRSFGLPTRIASMRLCLQHSLYRLANRPRLFWTVRALYRYLSRKGLAVGTYSNATFRYVLDSEFNWRMAPSVQARLRLLLLESDATIARQLMLTRRYDAGMRELGFSVPLLDPETTPVFMCYPILVEDKKALLEQARRARIELGDWFCSPVHPLVEKDWSAAGYERAACPVAEWTARHVITLPMHAGVRVSDADLVIRFLGRMRNCGILREGAPLTTLGSLPSIHRGQSRSHAELA